MKGVAGGLGRRCFVLAAIFAAVLAGAGCEPQQTSDSRSDRSTTTSPPSQEPEVLPAETTSPSPSADTLPTGSGLLPLPADAQAAAVEHHTDGDTLAVRAYAAGKVLESTAQITVRLLEIDTPETSPGTPIQCYGPQASAHLASLAPIGAKVYVAADKDRTDPYGRDLLYLWDAQGRSINLAMVEGGFAKAVLYAPNDRYISVLRQAEAKAKATKRGLWGACVARAPAPAPAKVTSRPAPAPGNCDHAYPTVCIPPGPPDLDCGQISHRRFTVLAPDPHGFDADHDGVGCESG